MPLCNVVLLAREILLPESQEVFLTRGTGEILTAHEMLERFAATYAANQRTTSGEGLFQLDTRPQSDLSSYLPFSAL